MERAASKGSQARTLGFGNAIEYAPIDNLPILVRASMIQDTILPLHPP
ncbi:hypothetical protein MAXJ12_26323 [Mesorhizobium alhagi CCNWXJ12-2]|uniref:Uncharacterized protein n=1 Tax=Mesorhizobium alhagi CCNWXJ12-2 TaxID=1107882 RepID=H0HYI4_9HYPH|nr:hypothetical protein MAXJ12_26323 [Mesorhizobium alhagi CCNWXJ12-2]